MPTLFPLYSTSHSRKVIWQNNGRLPQWCQSSRRGPKEVLPTTDQWASPVRCVKIMERIIEEHVTKHLKEEALLSREQHGFVERKSCLTNLPEALEDWMKIQDSKEGLDITFCDYTKAFDSVPHQRLLKKLSAYGIRCRTLRWIKDFLTERRQRVVVQGQASSLEDVTTVQVESSGFNIESSILHLICQWTSWAGTKEHQNVCRWHRAVPQDLYTLWFKDSAVRCGCALQLVWAVAP